ncbi:MAG: phosphoethanolamine methyltransferase, partial [Pseudomonadota bacterium]
TSLEKVQFDVVIDHHPLSQTEAAFLDIRPDYGATATILTEYLRAAKISPSRKLATALFYGIKTDTNNFTRQGQVEDMRAFRFLFPKISQSMVTKIETSEITRSALKYFHKALESVKIRKGMALVYLGRVDNPDTLVMLADFFMRVHDIHRTAVYGLFKDKLIVIFRAAGARMNAGRTAAESLAALGSAGGHRAMARAEIPLANLDPKLLEKDGALERFLNRRITGQDRRRKGKPEGPSHKPADKSIDNFPSGD